MAETTWETIERVGLIPVLRAKSVAQGRAVVTPWLPAAWPSSKSP